jgi:LmbE family N-acetylglucosaminyl deacetylase
MSFWLSIILYLGILTHLFTSSAFAQMNLAGSERTRLAIERLNNTGKMLMIAAHPDDENTALLAYFARGRKMKTGYLSLTRGEGGQNLIGSERGDLMGVIRTQELLAARRIDGAEQFFTRAIDFGYSKTADETLMKWDREAVLSDIVWVIRKFQPDVIVLRFSGTPRDGHGQHQASAILGREAFDAAADPKRFPEQLQRVKPWRAKRLMFNLFSFTREHIADAEATAGRIAVDTGTFDPALGYSYAEIAGMSRSQHRSQGMGAAEKRGTEKNYLVTIAGEPASKDPFDGIDTSWNRIAGGEQTANMLAQSAQLFNAKHPENSIPSLLKARSLAPMKLRRDEFDAAIALCMGLFLDASADRPEVVPDTPFEVKLTAINRSPVPAILENVSIGGKQEKGAELANNIPFVRNVPLKLDRPYTQPYWLQEPKIGAMYAISDLSQLGNADSSPALDVHFAIRVAGETVDLVRPVIRRYVDRVRGELTRPLVFVPPLAVRVVEPTLIFPTPESRKVEVEVKATQGSIDGQVRLSVPSGWTTKPASLPFRLSASGEQSVLSFEITPTAGDSLAEVRAIAPVEGKEYSLTIDALDYTHIPPQIVFRPASASLVRADIRIRSKHIGYVMGSGDDVPQALQQLGCDVTLLSAADLAAGDFSRFDAIVTGVRAYNTRPDLLANQKRLLAYVESGGTLVVQYNVPEGGFTGGNTHVLDHIGPYPMKISQNRVTVEDAPVVFPRGNDIFEWPNVITPRDFEGWVQERGLYFASEWDKRYTPLLTSNDPGEAPQAGGTLYAKFGKGTYIYTGYSWFRQLPAGVPGAYRIFANFLSAGKNSK